MGVRRRPRGLRQGARPDGCNRVFLNLSVVANPCSNMLPCLRRRRFSWKTTARGRFRWGGGGAPGGRWRIREARGRRTSPGGTPLRAAEEWAGGGGMGPPAANGVARDVIRGGALSWTRPRERPSRTRPLDGPGGRLSRTATGYAAPGRGGMGPPAVNEAAGTPAAGEHNPRGDAIVDETHGRPPRTRPLDWRGFDYATPPRGNRRIIRQAARCPVPPHLSWTEQGRLERELWRYQLN